MAARAAILLLLLAASLPGRATAGDLAVIVHPDREVRLDVEDVARIYLKQRRFWREGEPIVPVNRDSGSEARDAFVRKVFGASARQLPVYWNRQYFQGVLPPATLASDEAVRRFVAGERRAIGYVHPSVIDGSVRVVLQLHDP
jgi:ABC-type phosphate transport system substrate-binding protein